MVHRICLPQLKGVGIPTALPSLCTSGCYGDFNGEAMDRINVSCDIG